MVVNEIYYKPRLLHTPLILDLHVEEFSLACGARSMTAAWHLSCWKRRKGGKESRPSRTWLDTTFTCTRTRHASEKHWGPIQHQSYLVERLTFYPNFHWPHLIDRPNLSNISSQNGLILPLHAERRLPVNLHTPLFSPFDDAARVAEVTFVK